jgi:toxin ParE1/3/4
VKQPVWTSAARADLDIIAEYHAETDRRIGAMIIGCIEEAAAKLALRDTGRPGRIVGTREKSVSKTAHFIVYEVHNDLLMIYRIVHSARDWP